MSTLTDDEKRKHYLSYNKAFIAHIFEFGIEAFAAYPKRPDYHHEMTCGAKTREGHPCKNTNIYWNGRCRFHGGLSTGPKTLEGKKTGISKRP